MKAAGIRRFRVSDNDMISSAHLFLESYSKDQTLFHDLDPVTFTSTFEPQLRDAIEKAEALDADDEFRAAVSDKSSDLVETRERVVEAIRDARYFVKKAFGTNKELYSQFHMTDLNKNRKNTSQLHFLLQDFLILAREHSTELLQAGFPQALFQKLTELELELGAKSSRQRSAKRKRTLHTEERIDILNSVWDLMFDLSEAAKVISRHEADFDNIYHLPAPISQKNQGKKSPQAA